MAAAGSSTRLQDDNVDKSLECPICYEVFNQPKMLLCGHSLCARCLQRLMMINQICPICRRSIEIPTGGLQTNFALADVVNNMATRPNQVNASQATHRSAVHQRTQLERREEEELTLAIRLSTAEHQRRPQTANRMVPNNPAVNAIRRPRQSYQYQPLQRAPARLPPSPPTLLTPSYLRRPRAFGTAEPPPLPPPSPPPSPLSLGPRILREMRVVFEENCMISFSLQRPMQRSTVESDPTACELFAGFLVFLVIGWLTYRYLDRSHLAKVQASTQNFCLFLAEFIRKLFDVAYLVYNYVEDENLQTCWRCIRTMIVFLLELSLQVLQFTVTSLTFLFSYFYYFCVLGCAMIRWCYCVCSGQ